jgi:hypothetical protein
MLRHNNDAASHFKKQLNDEQITIHIIIACSLLGLRRRREGEAPGKPQQGRQCARQSEGDSDGGRLDQQRHLAAYHR